jgi:O-antigen/teichoic acid export membrane protein
MLLLLHGLVVKRFSFIADTPWPVAWKWAESFLSLGAIAGIQIAGFIILARSLGVEAYGVVVAVSATVAVAVEFVGLGGGEILIRAVARDPASYARQFGQALILAGITLPVVLAVALVSQNILFSLPTASYVVTLLTASDIITARASALAEHVAIAHCTIRVANTYRFLSGAIKAITVAIACFLFHVKTLEQWWAWQVSQAIFVMAVYTVHVIWRFGKPQWSLEITSVQRGLSFALNQVLYATQFSIDRMIIGTFGNASVLGMYGAATRLVQISLLPVLALLRMTYPTFFARGRDGIAATWAYACRLFPFVLLVSLGIAAALALASAFVIPILGSSFAGAGGIILRLAPVPILVSIQYIFSDALTGADYQAVRTSLLAGGVLLNAILMAFGMAWFGTPGIIAAVLLSNVSLLISIIVTAAWLVRRAAASKPVSVSVDTVLSK